MYVEAHEKSRVEAWVGEVRRLRYKDFQLATKPNEITREGETTPDNQNGGRGGLSEVESVKEFGGYMAQRGVWNWWRRGMGYT